MPRGGARGTEIVVNFTGARLAGAQEILFHEPGITVKKLAQKNGKHIQVTLTIATDCPLGPHAMRVRTLRGLTELRIFTVGALKEINEPEPNGDRTKAPKIALGTTVNGRITNEDVDYFAFDAAAGQRVNIEIEALRLGGPMFDPRIALLDSAGRELATADDTCLVRQDAAIGHKFAQAGTFVVEVRETAYGGGGGHHYRLHVGTFPRPLGVYPPGGKIGESIEVAWLGDSELAKQTVPAPAERVWPFGLFAQNETGIAPSWVPFRLTPWPNVLESEPNNNVTQATELSAPAAANGIIEKPGDHDYYRFQGKKGQRWDVRVWARQLRSPLDSVLTVWAISQPKPDAPMKLGGHLAGNDDSGGPDSFLRVKLPHDGWFAFRVRDHLERGGPLFTYRVEVSPVEPRLTLGLRPGDKPVRFVVPQGGRHAVLTAASRKDFRGPLKFAIDDLPAGVTAETPDMPGNVSTIPLLLNAAADAAHAGAMATLTARHTDEKQKISGGLDQDVITVFGDNRTPYATHRLTRLPVAVVEKSPFAIEIVQPKVPVVRNGSMKLKVRCTRDKGFDGPIGLRMLWNPPGVGSGKATISKGADEAIIHLNANGRAAIGKWPIAVIGSAGVAGDTVEVSTQLATLEISDVWLVFKLNRTRVDIGHKTEMTINVEKKRDFAGAARLELLGLPRNVTTQPIEITQDTGEVKFAIQTAKDSPPGRHGALFVRATITANGEPVVHNSGRGQLMIDKPLPPKSKEKPKPKPKKRRRRRRPKDKVSQVSPAAVSFEAVR